MSIEMSTTSLIYEKNLFKLRVPTKLPKNPNLCIYLPSDEKSKCKKCYAKKQQKNVSQSAIVSRDRHTPSRRSRVCTRSRDDV
jgi:hypothetical protein